MLWKWQKGFRLSLLRRELEVSCYVLRRLGGILSVNSEGALCHLSTDVSQRGGEEVNRSP